MYALLTTTFPNVADSARIACKISLCVCGVSLGVGTFCLPREVQGEIYNLLVGYSARNCIFLCYQNIIDVHQQCDIAACACFILVLLRVHIRGLS